MKWLASLVVLAVAVGAVYFVSDPARTRIDQIARGLTTWTPENIAKDPDGYLAFCETQTEQAIMKIKASSIAFHQAKGGCLARQEKAKEACDVGQPVLRQLKDLFRQSRSTNSWPLEWRGQPRDEQWMKKEIILLQKDVDEQQGELQEALQAVTQYEGQIARAEEELGKAHRLLEKIQQRQKQTALDRAAQSVDDVMVKMNASVEALFKSADELSNYVPLSHIVNEAKSTVGDQDFEAILNR